MKGTAPRSLSLETDQRERDQLSRHANRRVENLVIVDLLRNDLARVSDAGSVATQALFTVETYPTFHALTSTVMSRLNAGIALRERLASLFPCGSSVGAPKIRAMQLLRDLEEEPRGVYPGAIGSIGPTGDLDLNVAIRAAVLAADESGCYAGGAGSSPTPIRTQNRCSSPQPGGTR